MTAVEAGTSELRMARDIARQFATADHETAVAAITGHIARFWAPSMIKSFITIAAGGTDERLREVADRLRPLAQSAETR